MHEVLLQPPKIRLARRQSSAPGPPTWRDPRRVEDTRSLRGLWRRSRPALRGSNPAGAVALKDEQDVPAKGRQGGQARHSQADREPQKGASLRQARALAASSTLAPITGPSRRVCGPNTTLPRTARARTVWAPTEVECRLSRTPPQGPRRPGMLNYQFMIGIGEREVLRTADFHGGKIRASFHNGQVLKVYARAERMACVYA